MFTIPLSKSWIALPLLTLASCGIDGPKKSTTFFGGEIVNPSSRTVVLSKGDEVIDSTSLDRNNRFAFSLDSLQDGLYHFNHEPELQYVYLERGDSLMIRLNTLYFDESLVFSGKGEEINNFLLDVFLANEKEIRQIRKLYRLDPKAFKDKIDSLKSSRLAMFQELVRDGNLSERGQKIAKASVVYAYRTYMEEYPFKHKKYTGKQVIEKLPGDFYGYRDELTFNDLDLTYLRPYYNFMNNHVGNLSYVTCSEKCAIKNDVVRNQLHFNLHKLQLIDSLIKEKELKDNLFRYVAFDYLLYVHDKKENNETFIKRFHELSDNNRHMLEIDALYEGIRNVQPNMLMPDVRVSDLEGNTVSLRQIATAEDTKSVFYFWSGTNRSHFDYLKKRIRRLSDENPEYRFVGINIRTSDQVWRGLLENSGLDKNLQFRASDFENLKKSLIIDRLNKCIITDNGLIVNAFADVNDAL